MSRWVKLALADAPAAESGRAVIVEGRRIALLRHRGELFALDDVCPHQGASLADGVLHDGRVICPLHSWVFELGTGRCPRESHEPVQAYALRATNGSLEIELPEEETA